MTEEKEEKYEKVKVGDHIAAKWTEAPDYWHGDIEEDERGLYIDVHGRRRYLTDAEEITKLTPVEGGVYQAW